MDDIINRSENDRERHAHITRMQRDIAILDADLRKTRTLHAGIMRELEILKRKKSVLKAQEEELATKLRKVESEESQQEERVTHLKKQLNTY
jgi:chromosome segregation ATPase